MQVMDQVDEITIARDYKKILDLLILIFKRYDSVNDNFDISSIFFPTRRRVNQLKSMF
jgi:hypothetical protein